MSSDNDRQGIVANEENAIEDAPVYTPKKGLSVMTAAVFIIGAMCGSGILALPKSLVDSGWAGIPFLILCGIISSFTGTLLGKCWTIVRKRYPEYENRFIPDPYPTIGFRAGGKIGQIATRICIIATLYGGACVFLLLIAGNLANLVEKLSNGGAHLHTCYWILIVGAFLTPLTWLGTPKDFWQAGVLAAVTTTIGGILVVVGLAVMAPNQPPVTHSNPSFNSFFNAFGTILFAFGGASCFPTVQIDMKNPDKFPVSVVIGIMSVLTLYLPVSISGFIVIGDHMTSSNILDEMTGNWILYAVIFLITSHLLMAFLIIVNPVNQDLEGFFGMQNKFTWKRCLLRTCLLVTILFVSLTIPHFGVILSLVGGTTVTASNFIFPPLFYMLLARQQTPADGYGDLPRNYSETVYTAVSGSGTYSPEKKVGDSSLSPSGSQVSLNKPNWERVEIPTYMKFLLWEIILVGVVGGVSSSYSVIASLVDGSSGFTVPCYVNWATAG